MTPFIQNCAATDVTKRFHHDPGANSMLIQITDSEDWRPIPKHVFKETYHFSFLDVEADDYVIDPSMKISDTQAAELVRLLQRAKDMNMNVIVHCMAGICRSGAVCEVGVMMGFTDTEVYRQPNLLVKYKMMQVLGWTYDSDEKVDPDGWKNWKSEWDV